MTAEGLATHCCAGASVETICAEHLLESGVGDFAAGSTNKMSPY
jgi:hypothetical protein